MEKFNLEDPLEELNNTVGLWHKTYLFGDALDKKEGTGGFLKDIVVEGNNIAMDYSDQDDFMKLKILGIESYFRQGVEISIFAKSIELEWCFATNTKDDWEIVGISTWKMEKVGSSLDGDIIKSTEYTSWNKKLEERQFTTKAPAARIRYQPR
jgi:hypothetical protein